MCGCVSESFGDAAVRVWRSARFQDTSVRDKFQSDSEPSPAQGERGVCQFVPHGEPPVNWGSFTSLQPTRRCCRLARLEIQIHKHKRRQGVPLSTQLLTTSVLDYDSAISKKQIPGKHYFISGTILRSKHIFRCHSAYHVTTKLQFITMVNSDMWHRAVRQNFTLFRMNILPPCSGSKYKTSKKQTLKMVESSRTAVNFCRTTGRHNCEKLIYN